MISLLRKPFNYFTAPYRNQPLGVYILFISNVINRMGDFVNFFLTLYLTRYLGFDEKQTGLVIAAIGAAMMTGALLGGKLTDIAGRKKLMVTLQCLAVISIMFCGFYPDSSSVAVLLLFFTFFNAAVWPISSSLLTDLTRQDQRSAAFSLIYLGINVGVALGPVLAGYLFNHYRRWIFWGDGLSTVITLILIILYIKEPKQEELHLEESEQAVSGNSIKVLFKIPVLAVFTLLTIGSSFLYSQNSFTLPLYMEGLFSSESARLFGLIMSFNAVTVLVITPLFTGWFKKMPALQRIAVSQILYAVGFGILALPVTRVSWFFLSTFIWTAGEILHATSSGVFVAAHSPVNHRGRFNSLMIVTKGAGKSLGPAAAGFILAGGGMTLMWGLCFVLGVLLFLAMMGLDRIDRFGPLKKDKPLVD